MSPQYSTRTPNQYGSSALISVKVIKNSVLILLVTLLIQSCTSDGVREGDILSYATGECFKKNNGELEKIRCPINEASILSTDQRLDSLERFKNFLLSERKQVALQLSKQRKLNNETYYSAGYHDYSDSLKMMVGEKFIVDIYFRNYSLFPQKYISRKTFRVDQYSNRYEFLSDTSLEFTTKWTNRIFRYYLGDSYERYEPQLGVVHDQGVSIELLIEDVSDLESIIYRDPIISIRHAGDPEIFLEEIAN